MQEYGRQNTPQHNMPWSWSGLVYNTGNLQTYLFSAYTPMNRGPRQVSSWIPTPLPSPPQRQTASCFHAVHVHVNTQHNLTEKILIYKPINLILKLISILSLERNTSYYFLSYHKPEDGSPSSVEKQTCVPSPCTQYRVYMSCEPYLYIACKQYVHKK